MGKKVRVYTRGFVTAYLITCVVNGKQYVGITTSSAQRRWWGHCADARNRTIKNTRFLNAIRKYGEDAFTITEIASARTWEDACEIERALITAYGTFSRHGYNSTVGGEGSPGSKHSDESRAKRSVTQKGRKHSPEAVAKMVGRVWSAESRAKGSAAKLGRKQTPEHVANRIASLKRGGKKIIVSAETRAKISARQIGRKLSPETIAKKSAAMLGRKLTAETKAKISSALIGRTVSEEIKAKTSAALRGHSVSQATLDKIAATKLQRRLEQRQQVAGD